MTKRCRSCKYWFTRMNNCTNGNPCIEFSEYLEKEDISKSQEKDNVNHPDHYTNGGIECIEAIRAALTPDEFRGYIKGNIIKYTWRERLKNGDEDLKKIIKYIELFFKKD